MKLKQTKSDTNFFFSDGITIELWQASILKNGWGDYVCCRATCECYRRPVAVVRKHTDQDPTLFIPDVHSSDHYDVILTQLDESSPGSEHYDALLLGGGMQQTKTKTKGDGMQQKKTKTQGTKKKRKRTLKKAAKICEANLESGKADVCNDEANVQNDNKRLKRPVACDDDEKVALAKIHDAGFSDFSIRAVPMTRCPRCNNECTIEQRRITKKSGTYWICKPCISRYTQLRSIDAEWPPASFKLLSKEDQQKFYDQVRTTSNKKKLKLNVDEYLNISKVDRKVNEVGGEYLPLSVLRKKRLHQKKLEEDQTRLQGFQRAPLARQVLSYRDRRSFNCQLR